MRIIQYLYSCLYFLKASETGFLPYHTDQGQQDLKQGIIRTVGDPKERFSEDYLRIIRAVRFSAKLNFHIEHNTQQAMIKEAKNLSKISFERIKDELNMVLKYKPYYTFKMIDTLDIWDILKNMGLNFQLTNAII